jgi:DNA primase
MIPRETVSQIIDSAAILDVVGDYVSLKRRGANYLGLCPFHNEKSPSFTVSPAKGIFKCFGCGKSGDSVKFLMEQETMSYPEALRYLAKKAGIEIKEEVQTDENILEQKEKEGLFLIHAFAQKTFTEDLFQNEEGKNIGLSYIKERGFTQNSIDKFLLGYALSERDHFSKKALAEGYQKDYLVKSGIVIDGERGLFDRFAGRVIFPIQNLSGRVIGFGGRILTNDKKTAKYLNSPETDIYHKSNVLYGLTQARKTIIQNDNCFLVEGYTDVISLHQAGVENVVSSSGTSLTIEQIRLVRRFTKNITVMYDGDAAGIKASFRGIDLLLAEGMNIKVLLFPDGEDPDSFSRKTPQHELLDFLAKNTTDFIRFKASLLLKEVQNDPIKKAGLIREMVDSISLIPDVIVRSLFVKDCANLMEVGESMLTIEVNKQVRKKRDEGQKKSQQENFIEELKKEESLVPEIPEIDTSPDPVIKAEWHLIRLLVRYGERTLHVPLNSENTDSSQPQHWETLAANYMKFLLDQIEYRFKEEIHQSIFEENNKRIENNVIPEQQVFLKHENESIQKLAIDLVTTNHHLSPNWSERFKLVIVSEEDHLLRTIDKAFSRLQLQVVLEKIASVSSEMQIEKDEDNISVLMQRIKELNESKTMLSNILGIVILA